MVVDVILIVLQLIYLEGILGIDNAAVLGSMVSHLPHNESIPWPRPLRFLQKPAHRLLGGQRLAALKVGLLGAYLGRGAMMLMAASIIQSRWLLLIGGLYLIKLAADHLGEMPLGAGTAAAEGSGAPAQRLTRSFWSVVLAVELADLAFSLDNVVAAVALSRQIWVVLIGVALGILMMRIAAGVFGTLLRRYPVLEAAGYLLALNIGCELLAEEFAGVHLTDTQKFGISLGTLLLTLLYGHSRSLQRVGRHFAWLKRVLGLVNLFFVAPFNLATWIFASLLTVVRALARVLGLRRLPRDPSQSTPMSSKPTPGDKWSKH